MPDPDIDEITSLCEQKVHQSIKRLLERKHLYQPERIDVSDLHKKIVQIKNRTLPNIPVPGRGQFPQGIIIDAKKEQLRSALQKFQATKWNIVTPGQFSQIPISTRIKDYTLYFERPTILTNCELCDDRDYPHNPIAGTGGIPHQILISSENDETQVFSFVYQCQNCKKEPLIFMVRRDELKLTITGRSRFERPQVPPYIPKQEIDFFRDSIISFQTGRTLAAIFYLRTFLEQYLRRTTETKGKTRGENLANTYLKTLPEDFPSRFKNIREIYAQLSDCIHSVSSDDEAYEQSKSAVEQHFRALQLFQNPMS